ncbi:MAG: hypothetical protein K0S38_394, partial [Candidatus Paceibacter sp.]|nr:hypothetical protein [Candidatus Paceibacter sp.]
RNGVYDGDITDSTVETFKIQGQYRISDLCSLSSTNVETCGTSHSVDITFTRPNPDAYFCWYNDYTSPSCNFDAAVIKVISYQEGAIPKTITIRPTGQISIQNESTP